MSCVNGDTVVAMLHILLAIGLSVLIFGLTLASAWFETQSIRAVVAWEERRDTRARERAARSDLATWLISVFGLVSVLEVGWWVLPGEALGVYYGAKLAMR